jgi:hypothetical protein
MFSRSHAPGYPLGAYVTELNHFVLSMRIPEKPFIQWFGKLDLKVCGDGTLIEILCFWTLTVLLFLFKTQTEFCLRLHV